MDKKVQMTFMVEVDLDQIIDEETLRSDYAGDILALAQFLYNEDGLWWSEPMELISAKIVEGPAKFMARPTVVGLWELWGSSATPRMYTSRSAVWKEACRLARESTNGIAILYDETQQVVAQSNHGTIIGQTEDTYNAEKTIEREGKEDE